MRAAGEYAARCAQTSGGNPAPGKNEGRPVIGVSGDLRELKEIVPMDIHFGELPPSRRDKHKNVAIADALKARPGEWAMIGHFADSQATNIKTGAIKAYQPAGSFEAVCRNANRQDRKSDIWARYVGQPNEAA